jgi:uridine kinase
MDVGKPFVIAISAVSGGGKTTVTKHLAEQLHNSRAIYFDELELCGPEDIPKWVEEGGDPHAWDLTPLVEVPTEFYAESPDFIVLDYPFLYGHSQMTKFINLAVFVDTPLDIAMARRVIRDFEDRPTEEVIREMQHYLSRARLAYVDMFNTVKPQSDLVVDGTLSVQEIVGIILERLRSVHGM